MILIFGFVFHLCPLCQIESHKLQCWFIFMFYIWGIRKKNCAYFSLATVLVRDGCFSLITSPSTSTLSHLLPWVGFMPSELFCIFWMCFYIAEPGEVWNNNKTGKIMVETLFNGDCSKDRWCSFSMKMSFVPWDVQIQEDYKLYDH